MRTNTCLNCKAENKLKAKYCWNCGAKLKGQLLKYVIIFLIISAIATYFGSG